MHKENMVCSDAYSILEKKLPVEKKWIIWVVFNLPFLLITKRNQNMSLYSQIEIFVGLVMLPKCRIYYCSYVPKMRYFIL